MGSFIDTPLIKGNKIMYVSVEVNLKVTLIPVYY